jgi:Flp pilus assembly pilin Flp
VRAIREFLRVDGGATSIEYAVMLGLIVLVIFCAIAALGTENGGMWGGIDSKLDHAGLGK